MKAQLSFFTRTKHTVYSGDSFLRAPGSKQSQFFRLPIEFEYLNSHEYKAPTRSELLTGVGRLLRLAKTVRRPSPFKKKRKKALTFLSLSDDNKNIESSKL